MHLLAFSVIKICTVNKGRKVGRKKPKNSKTGTNNKEFHAREDHFYMEE